ncbi:MAG: hypothetical protein ACLGIN_09185, partial [Candidatus Sericytochromatia bacterium]
MGRRTLSLLTGLATMAAITACSLNGPASAPGPATGAFKRPTRPAPLSSAGVPVDPSSVIRPGEGGQIIANNAGSLIGKVKAPATLISDKGMGLVSDKGLGYRVLAIAQQPAPGVKVSLLHADGSPVKGEDGKPLEAVTDAEGAYAFDYRGNTANMLIQAHLSDEKGDLVALLPKDAGAGPRTVDLDLTSTLVMRYVLKQYVQGDATVLDKLPAGVEAETRRAMAAAVASTGFEPPEDLAPERLVGAVEKLRTQDAGIDAQLEAVRKLLVAGVSDQGNGQPADRFETDAVDVAVGADGTIYFAGVVTQRVWKKDAQGHLAVFAGSGMPPNDNVPGPTQPAAGDGGPATKAIVLPQNIELLPDGRM